MKFTAASAGVRVDVVDVPGRDDGRLNRPARTCVGRSPMARKSGCTAARRREWAERITEAGAPGAMPRMAK
jgi:hypothetical protein